MAVKYYEEVCFINDNGERFFFDYEFQRAVSIPKNFLVDYQFEFLKVVDHELYISEQEYSTFVDKIMKLAAFLKQ